MVSAEEPSRSRLDECFLMGRYQSPPPTLGPLLPWSSYELTILWHTPHSSRIRPSASVALTSVDGAEEKVPASTGWVCGLTSLPAHSYRMEGFRPSRAEPHLHLLDAPTGGWTSGFRASPDGCAPGLPGQDARQWGSRSGFSLSQGPVERDRPGSKHSQSHCPSHRAFNVQPYSVGAPLLAHDDGDERQSSLPWRSNNRLLIRQPVWTSCGGLCWTFQGGSEVVSAMRLFLPKRTSSSSASSCPRPGPTQQTAKSTPTAPGPRPPDAHAWHDATLSRSAKDPCPRSYWFRRLRNPPEQPGRKRRGPSLATAGPILQAAFIVFLAAPLIAGRREKCVHGSSWANYSAQVSDRCDNGQNKTHTFSCQWFFHFCRRCWINSVPHPPSRFTRQP